MYPAKKMKFSKAPTKEQQQDELCCSESGEAQPVKRKQDHQDRQEASDLEDPPPVVLNFGSPEALTRAYLKLQSDNGGLLNQIKDLKEEMRDCIYEAEERENEYLRKLIKCRRSIDALHEKIDDLRHALRKYERKEEFHSSHTASVDCHSAQEQVDV